MPHQKTKSAGDIFAESMVEFLEFTDKISRRNFGSIEQMIDHYEKANKMILPYVKDLTDDKLKIDILTEKTSGSLQAVPWGVDESEK